MPIALAAVAVVGLGLSVYQTVDAKKKQKEAEKAAAEYERQQLKNPYEDLQVSTLGADLQQQNLNNQVATATDALRAGGARAIIGGLPTLYDNVIQANNQIAAGLDSQFNQNQQLSAQGNAMVQGMTEQRERDDLLGIGNAINNAQQEYNQGLSNTVKSIANVASAASTIPTSSTSSVNNTNANSNQFGNAFKFNTTLINSGTQPQNAIQANLYNQNDLNQYNSYLYGTRRGF
jgi:hypothetical protein